MPEPKSISQPPLLEIKSLTVGYKSPIVTGISMACGRGLFVSLLGANGSGKTTLLRTVSKHIKPLAGQVFINGQSLSSVKTSDLARVMSVVLTDRSSVPMLRGLEFVALGRHPHSDFLGRLTDADLSVVEKALESVKAADLAERFIDELSDGERQKIVLARALAQEPKLMLLDEPTAHLDLKHRLEVLGILRGLCQKRELTVLAALHDVEAAAKVSDLVVTIKDGRLTGFGPSEQILTPEAVKELYDCPHANYDSLLGSLEMAPDGRAGRAFVLGGRDTAALIYRLLAKKGYSLISGFFLESDLDAHVAAALGGTVFSFKDGENPPEEKFLAESLKELQNAAIMVQGPAGGPLPDLRQRLVSEAKNRGIPVLTVGPDGDLGPLMASLKKLDDGQGLIKSAA